MVETGEKRKEEKKRKTKGTYRERKPTWGRSGQFQGKEQQNRGGTGKSRNLDWKGPAFPREVTKKGSMSGKNENIERKDQEKCGNLRRRGRNKKSKSN